MLFVDNRVLFDNISQLASDLNSLSQKDTQSLMGMLQILQAQNAK